MTQQAGTRQMTQGFDMDAFCDAIDAARRARGLDWYAFARELWQQSSTLNEVLQDHPLCGGAVSRMWSRGAASCQYALYMLRWLQRPPEDFLDGPGTQLGPTALPQATSGQRLRFDLPMLHGVMDAQRRSRGLAWKELGEVLGCSPARLTNLRRAREADLALTLRVTQWLGLPAAHFVRAMGAAELQRDRCAG